MIRTEKQMKKQDQIIKNLVARTKSLGGTYSRINYEYIGVVSLRLQIGNSHAMVNIGPRGSFQYVSTWFEDQHGGYISVDHKKSRPSWTRAADLCAWFWSVSRDMCGSVEAQRLANEFLKTASINFNDKMVAA